MAAADPHTRVGIDPTQITGVVLAGGRGMRMGGLDKGLQLFEGLPLAQQALQRLQKQVGPTMINANRHLDQYQSFGVPVWPDVLPGYAGPLAGFITALQHCHTPYLMTVPCDTPRFPTDLVQQLALALVRADSAIAVATTLEENQDGHAVWRPQPVFCMLRTSLRTSLEQFTARGGRKVETWTAQHNAVQVPFDTPSAFFNVNTLAQLHALRS